ncbi:MAG: FAD binding domain-containing protein [Eubacteriales bacterium]|nr:FAD binding domain-containing protein [Eubacteriales bacterium]
MITIREYLKVKTLQEAWTANQKRSNRVLGGMGWMKMSSANVASVIDLTDLHLDKIEETEEEFIIGAMVSLRQFETHEGLNQYFCNAPKESMRHIVGIQFRNCATMGGSVWLRPGFSDPLTLLLSLDSQVELWVGKEESIFLPLADFCKQKRDNSILVAIHVKKDARKVAYQSFRNTETDFPVLTASVSKKDGIYRAAVGARPALALAIEADNVEELIKKAQELNYSSNIRASADYRKMLADVLIRRAVKELEEEK